MSDLAISRQGSGLPSRVICHGVEGVGKSSLGAHSVKPIFLMTRGETGLLTLIDNGLVPETDHFDEIYHWRDLTRAVSYLTVTDLPNRTLVLDTLNGAERLCFESVCQDKFKGSWDYFSAYGKGPEIAQVQWIDFLTMLDRLRVARKMAIMLLCHTKVKRFANPEGDDYDRYTPDMHDKIWGLSHKWADIILFGNFETFAEKDKGALKAKAHSSGNRILYTQRTAAWDAKNRVGLPAEIPMGNTGAASWAQLYQAIRAARKLPEPTTEQAQPEKVGAS